MKNTEAQDAEIRKQTEALQAGWKREAAAARTFAFAARDAAKSASDADRSALVDEYEDALQAEGDLRTAHSQAMLDIVSSVRAA